MRRLALASIAACTLLAGCGGAEVVAPTAKTVIGTLPKSSSAPVGSGDVAAGKKEFLGQGCGGCHTYKPAGTNGKVGPDLDNLAADAKKANQGPVQDYAAESIKNPSSYTVPGFPSGVMPSYSSLQDTQVSNLVAFLTQKS